MNYKEIEGDIITEALSGNYDVVAHGCNCQCVMSAGLAPQMVRAFGTDKFFLENLKYKGNINKLGQIDFETFKIAEEQIQPRDYIGQITDLHVVNCYTQFNYGKNYKDGDSVPADYEAIVLCMRKINKIFTGKHILLPLIGCGLAGAIWDWTKELGKIPLLEYNKFKKGIKKDVKTIIQEELKDCQVTVVYYNKNMNFLETY